MLDNIIIKNDYSSPEDNNIEIVERKGFGHPDTLADQMAKECSRVYSQYCLDNFGCVLHHNFDKLYVGAGCFRYIDGKVKMLAPIRVDLNGRCSNTMNGKKIDLEKLLKPVIVEYMGSVLPTLDVKNELVVNINCTQNSKFTHWFEPRDVDDVPDAKELFANDTSVCVAHYPLTTCEELTLRVSNFFWKYDSKTGYPKPKYKELGQDIKVMTFRVGKKITISVALPVYYDAFDGEDEYIKIIKKYEKKIWKDILDEYEDRDFEIYLDIDKSVNKSYHYYTLAKGTCAECGEEGVVGRGNNLSGFIPSFRPYSMESPFGKNERYHTGRVLSNLSVVLSQRIYNELGIRCSIYCLTQNRAKLLRPSLLYVSTDKKLSRKEEKEIADLVETVFDEETYLDIIMKKNII